MLRTTPNTYRTKKNNEDIQTLMSYSHYLIMKAQFAGNLMFDSHTPTNEEREIANKCQELCERIARRFSICKVEDIPTLLGCYDTLYRIGYKRLPDSGFMTRLKNRVIDAWRAGNHDIEESSLLGMIALDVKYPTGMVNSSWVAVYQSIMTKWISTLRAHNKFPNVTSYENYQRLALIMRENLDAYLDNSDEEKLLWYKHNKINNLSTLSSRILRSYRSFISSTPYGLLSYDEKTTIDNNILVALSTRKDLNQYDRETFRMALKFNLQIADIKEL